VSDAVLALTGFLGLPVLVLAGVAYAFTRRLRRSNRVGPGGFAGAVPLTWLWSPGWAASLHRRLRSAGALAGSVAGPAPGRRGRRVRPDTDSITQLAREVLDEAVRLDRELVTANLAAPGTARTQALAALDYEVRNVEDAAQRVHRLAAQRAELVRTGAGTSLSLNERISTLEEALRELHTGPRHLER
jgi:hypothetical protein